MHSTATTPAPSPAAAWSYPTKDIEIYKELEISDARTKAVVGKKLGDC